MRLYFLFAVILLFGCSNGAKTNKNVEGINHFSFKLPEIKNKIESRSTIDSVSFEYIIDNVDESFCFLKDDTYELNGIIYNNSSVDKYFLTYSCDNNGLLLGDSKQFTVVQCIMCNVSYPMLNTVKAKFSFLFQTNIRLYESVKIEEINPKLFFYPLSKNQNMDNFYFSIDNEEKFLIDGSRTEIK